MYTYNITFVVDPAKETHMITYIKEDLLPKIFNGSQKPEIKKVIEAGGEKPGPEHGLSMALAMNFDTEEKAHLWHDHELIPALEDFNAKFGTNALYFITLLEEVG